MICTNETVESLLRDGRDLFADHAREDTLHQDIPLEIDEAHYHAGARLGMYRCFGVRDGETLVGYAVFSVFKNPLYRSSLQANLGALYVDPAYRLRVPLTLLEFIESTFRQEKVQLLRYHAIPESGLAHLLEYNDYTLAHYEYEKRLDT